MKIINTFKRLLAYLCLASVSTLIFADDLPSIRVTIDSDNECAFAYEIGSKNSWDTDPNCRILYWTPLTPGQYQCVFTQKKAGDPLRISVVDYVGSTHTDSISSRICTLTYTPETQSVSLDGNLCFPRSFSYRADPQSIEIKLKALKSPYWCGKPW